MNASSVFAHPRLAPVRAVLEGSPTAQRELLARVDDLATEVVIKPFPRDGSSLADVYRFKREPPSYSPGTNELEISEAFLAKEPHTVRSVDRRAGSDLELEAIPEREQVLTIAHEALHRVQSGRAPRLTSLVVGRTEPYRAAAAGVRALFRPEAGATPFARFGYGVDRFTMRYEIGAHRFEDAVARDLGWSTSGVRDDADLMRYLRSLGYANDMRSQRRHYVAEAAMPAMLLGGGGGIAATFADVD